MDFPSLECLYEVHRRLSMPDDGFNYALRVACDEINNPAAERRELAMLGPIEPFEIDFSRGSKNYWRAQTTIDDLLSATNCTLPAMVLYGRNANEGARPIQKFHRFSGTVNTSLDVHLTWQKAKLAQDMEALGAAVEGALIWVFNRDDQFVDGSGHTQNWGPTISYNGQINVDRGDVALGLGENWSQLIRCTLAFEVNAPNS